MKDFFALLGQPRRPWLDRDQVNHAFVAAAAEFHPDRIHEAPEATRQAAHQRYTELNEAFLCLGETRSRLRHLLELEQGQRFSDLQEIPDGLMTQFTRVTRQFREADQFLQERGRITSPLLKVALLERGETLRDALQQTQNTLLQEKQDLENTVRALDARWVSAHEPAPQWKEDLCAELEAACRLISFYDRWLQQAQSRLLQWLE